MRFEETLVQAIRNEAQKLIHRHNNYHQWLHEEIRRKNLRTTTPTTKIVCEPIYWEESNLFNPFYVHKHTHAIAKSIARKILSKTYAPHPPCIREIPKQAGGSRNISIYKVPDAAVSTLFFTYLMKKNRHRFSSFTYAYRNDRNAHFAVQDIFYELNKSHRVFIAEYDFSKFFDNIDHNFIINELQDNNFFISETEEHIIKAFLKSHHPTQGIPQGTSISLFLANVACWSLDRQLEFEGIKFARYADDTIIWSQQYDKICNALNILFEFSIKSKIPINVKKSEGISLLVPFPHEPQEIYRVKNFFEYLGYSISPRTIGIKKQSEDKIKNVISYIIYSNVAIALAPHK